MVGTNFTYDSQLSPKDVKVHELIQHLLVVLSDKEKYIIENRFALEKDKKQTLEQIGQHFGVTRERVRQIERGALRKLERNAQNTNIRILTEFAKAILEKEGGIVKDKYFKEMLVKILPNVSEDDLHELHLALVLESNIHFKGNTLKYDPHWHLSSMRPELIKQTAQASIKALSKAKRVLSFKELTGKVNTKIGQELNENTLTHILRLTKACKFTEEGAGLYSWRHIHPRTLRDKIQFVLQREKRPMHFDKIAKMIREASFDDKQVNIQAVHNELIRNDNFVLIGRGIYALEEWGYKSGTVADVIEDILSDGTPRSREEITKAVLKRRHVKTITIYLNLKNKAQFSRVGRDQYTLSKFAQED